jgi:DNA-binding transcriptional ArsR family regulator
MSTLNEDQATNLSDLFSALSDPTRLRIISLLLESELSVGEISTALQMSASAISHQLSRLRYMHLVRSRKVGRQVFYHLDDEHVADLFRQGLNHVMHSE